MVDKALHFGSACSMPPPLVGGSGGALEAPSFSLRWFHETFPFSLLPWLFDKDEPVVFINSVIGAINSFLVHRKKMRFKAVHAWLDALAAEVRGAHEYWHAGAHGDSSLSFSVFGGDATASVSGDTKRNNSVSGDAKPNNSEVPTASVSGDMKCNNSVSGDVKPNNSVSGDVKLNNPEVAEVAIGTDAL
jgi:hypothetical protein